MIVKAQRCLSDLNASVLIYNQSRNFCVELPMSSEWQQRFGSELKAYFKVEFHSGELQVLEKVARQRW